jgi:hypothetical protein
VLNTKTVIITTIIIEMKPQKNVNNTHNTHFTTTITGGSSIFAPGSTLNISFSV